MSMPTGRSENRTPLEVPVVLSLLNKRPFKESTFTENVSPSVALPKKVTHEYVFLGCGTSSGTAGRSGYRAGCRS